MVVRRYRLRADRPQETFVVSEGSPNLLDVPPAVAFSAARLVPESNGGYTFASVVDLPNSVRFAMAQGRLVLSMLFFVGTSTAVLEALQPESIVAERTVDDLVIRAALARDARRVATVEIIGIRPADDVQQVRALMDALLAFDAPRSSITVQATLEVVGRLIEKIVGQAQAES